LEDGNLKISSTENIIYEITKPSFIGIRQAHLTFEAQTELMYMPKNENDIAGMACYQKENHNLYLEK
jgi:alpha-N-arabinofuranosidase